MNGKTFVTGQQTALLGGPLYTTYKVLGAVFHAQKEGGEAIYWLETNDADFNEINHIDYLDDSGRLQTLTWDIPSGGRATGYIEVDKRLIALLEQFFSTIRQTEFTPVLRDLALDAYAEGRTMEQASLRLAQHLFGHLPLRLFTPFDPDYRSFIQPILRAEARRTPEGAQCDCFALIDKQRKALFRKEGRFITRDGAEMDIETVELAPNVKTRPVCQDAWFHTHAYIAGPGEVVYLAELGPYYQFHNIRQALTQPRMSIRLIDSRIRRLAAKTGVDPETAANTDKEKLLNSVLARSSGFNPKELQNRADAVTQDYLNQLAALNPETEDLKRLRRLLTDEMKKMTGAMRAREKEKAEALLRDAAWLSDCIRPRGHKQERVFNLFWFMNLYGGKGLIPYLLDHYHPDAVELELK